MAGCGKSTLGKAIAEKYDLSFVDTDKLIESNWQMTLEGIKTKYGYKTVIRSEQEVILNLDTSTQIISTSNAPVSRCTLLTPNLLPIHDRTIAP